MHQASNRVAKGAGTQESYEDESSVDDRVEIVQSTNKDDNDSTSHGSVTNPHELVSFHYEAINISGGVVEGTNNKSQIASDPDATKLNDIIRLEINSDEDDYSNSAKEDGTDDDNVVDKKATRKQAKKAAKAARRAQREGRADPSFGQKKCDLCGRSVDLLIRCQIDQTEQWKMVCGKCWKTVSGGVVDGDADHPHYRYGGLWKNRKQMK
jgi:hypothetical protein